jgi:hypothetical protein
MINELGDKDKTVGKWNTAGGNVIKEKLVIDAMKSGLTASGH